LLIRTRWESPHWFYNLKRLKLELKPNPVPRIIENHNQIGFFKRIQFQFHFKPWGFHFVFFLCVCSFFKHIVILFYFVFFKHIAFSFLVKQIVQALVVFKFFFFWVELSCDFLKLLASISSKHWTISKLCIKCACIVLLIS